MDRIKELLFRFPGTAKSAGQLAAAQSRKAKLASVDLSSAYHELGKRLHQSGRFLTQFSSEHEQIEKLDKEIEVYSQKTAADGSELKYKLKAGADNVKKAAC